MSHYTVAVFHTEDQDVDELLAPFDENMRVEPYICLTREEAIDFARKNHEGFDEKTDEECWQFMADDAGEDMVDKDGNILSTYNPNSKWDWYLEGGRWSGLLKVGHEHKDQAKVKEIDFSMDKEVYNAALRFWDVAVDHKPAEPGEKIRSFCNEEYYREYYGDRETYARRQAQFSTFAVITPDGEWHEKGESGWLGISGESSKEAEDWDEHYKERFIDTADPEWYITIIDCHI